MYRSILSALALTLTLVPLAGAATGPGGWSDLGAGAKPTFPALNGVVFSLNSDAPGVLYVGGDFTDAGGDPNADYIARWDGQAWKALGASRLTGAIHAIAYRGGKVYVGGTFQDAGGSPDADNLAVWDGSKWGPVCKASSPGSGVYALAISGSTLYIGGSFENGAGIPSADYLLACDLGTGAARSLVNADGDISSAVNALAFDSRGTLYAGGGFSNLDGIPAADFVAQYDGRAWHALGSGPGTTGGALRGSVRDLITVGADVYVGTDSSDVAGLPQADQVARWNGSAWSALGSDASGTNGIFPPRSYVYSLASSGSRIFVGGQFRDAGGNALADNLVAFDGKSWSALGSNGAGDGAIGGNSATVYALMPFDGKLHAGGRFTRAGGNALASFIASYPLAGAPPAGGGGGGTTTTTPSGGAAPPATGTATGTVTVNGRPFTTGRVPYNVTVDVTRGRLVLRTDTGTLAVSGANGITAAFVLVRGTDRGRTVVELRLAKGNFAVCPNRKTSSARAAATTVRQLWGDGTGRFRTKGRYSSASVRGTRWLTADRCDGTQTRVTRGVVQVLDIPRNRQVTLRAGGSYLARP